MNKCLKLYNNIYENDLLKIRKCAESIQTMAQYQSFRSWSEEVIEYLAFKFSKIDAHWIDAWEYTDKIEIFIRDCQKIALSKL